jgi:hypothetical protein
MGRFYRVKSLQRLIFTAEHAESAEEFLKSEIGFLLFLASSWLRARREVRYNHFSHPFAALTQATEITKENIKEPEVDTDSLSALRVL